MNSMKPLGMGLYVVGAGLAIIVLLWMATGFYASDIPAILVLCGLGFGLLFAGSKLHSDKNPNKAVEWRPSTPAPPAPQPRAVPADDPDTGDMMNCSNCGNPSRVGAVFCGHCGAKLADHAATQAPQSPQQPTAAPVPVHSSPPPPPPPPPPPATQDAPAPESAPALELAPAAAPEPAPEPPSQANMITLPPGLVPSPPAGARVETPRATASLADAVFITSPAMPAVAAVAEDLDATRLTTPQSENSVWKLVLPDGQHHVVDGAVLVGRNPSSSARWPNAQLLSVDDPTKSVSKTHALIEATQDGLWITDLASTNGVVVMMPDGRELDGGGARLSVEPGSEIELGDYNIQIRKES